MQLDAVMVRAKPADLPWLRRAGGEVWQEHGRVTAVGGITWSYAIVKLPAAAAIRLGLIALGAECSEVADPAPVERPTETRSRGGTRARRRPPRADA